ncbi:MAG: flagellar hook-length control protein FliK [Gammaproteobacteria bacterium]|nr:flagellar hook-length control protein FliK [Gammaproteobacteria bacterium]
MTEILSMTLLSAEPVSAAKPQAAQSNDGATEPDQSFAATLAAEVNGKAPDKSAKALAKTRQNNASDLADSKDAAANPGSTASDVKNDHPKPVTTKESESGDEEKSLSTDPDTVLTQNDKAEAEQSHWLNLLEKAKSLQERLSKAETAADNAEVKEKAGSTAMELVAQVATEATQQKDKTKATELPAASDIASAKAKSAEQKDGAIVLDEKLTAEQSSEQHLTAEELKALKLITQSDKTAATKNQPVDTSALKQTTASQKTAAEAELIMSETATEKVVDKSLLAIQKDTGSDQSKTMAHIEKPLKANSQTAQTAQPAHTEKQPEVDTQVLVATATASKTPLQAEQASTLLKAATATTTDNQIEAEVDTEALPTQQGVTDAKVSVQAQSAAALIAPAAQHAKAPATEAKVTTEEALKQIQTAAIAAQGEQGASSSGESSHQGTAETILSVIEQQKSTNTVATETNSFSSQLKSSLEKINSGISVTGRDAVSESSQKQVDQLGQKLNLIQPEASNQLKEKMLMMVKDKVHTAEIRLDPSELGSMQIKISLQQDQMSVQFMVQQGNAKELMEQQMPKLKELLQQQGIELSQGSVQQQNQSSSGQEGGRRTAGGSGMGSALDSSDELIDPAILPTKNSDRVVDYYA